MPIFTGPCKWCGKEFTRYHGPKVKQPQFCSRACYWEAGGASVQAGRGKRSQTRKQKWIVDENGEQRLTQRSHWVWMQHHPGDSIGPDDVIHHIDGNFLNDDITNLSKMPRSEHQRMHANSITPEERSRRMRAYHAANPGKQRKGKPKTCPVCGEEFYRPPSARAQTCSYACAVEYRRRQKQMT